VERVGWSYTGILQYAIRLRCFRKHKLKEPKGKEEEEERRRSYLPIIIENISVP
jgi:hypothetical protein